MQTKISANLDFLRAVAVLLVLVQHLVYRFHGPECGFPPIGTFGVLIFFVHTCLVLMYSMNRTRLAGAALFVNFYIRRIFRIYPLSVLAVLTAVALHLDSGVNGIPGLSHVESIPGWRIFSNLFLVQNIIKPGSIINVLWSLPFEVQMYIFLPFLYIWVRRTRVPIRTLCILWILSVLGATARDHLLVHTAPGSLAWRLSIIQYVPNFVPGIIAFALPTIPKMKSFVWPLFVLTLVCIFSLFPNGRAGWVLCFILGFAIPFFAEIRTEWLRTISNRIATYSYGIYLSHQFCIWLIADPLAALQLWIKVAILIALLIAMPIVLYHFVEKPMIKVGVELADKWQALTADLTAARQSNA